MAIIFFYLLILAITSVCKDATSSSSRKWSVSYKSQQGIQNLKVSSIVTIRPSNFNITNLKKFRRTRINNIYHILVLGLSNFLLHVNELGMQPLYASYIASIEEYPFLNFTIMQVSVIASGKSPDVQFAGLLFW